MLKSLILISNFKSTIGLSDQEQGRKREREREREKERKREREKEKERERESKQKSERKGMKNSTLGILITSQQICS